MKMIPWRELIKQSFTKIEDLPPQFQPEGTNEVIEKYPMIINPYFFSLIEEKGDPIYRQCIPHRHELKNICSYSDPFMEDINDETFIHRYPDRILMKVSNHCALNCRHCMRKRNVGKINDFDTASALDYLKRDNKINEVILSGGDPLLRSTYFLNNLISEIDDIPHVETIRIHTRTISTLPQRITKKLVSVLEKFDSLHIVTHFNHAREITEISQNACKMLVRAAVPLYCQSVLLKGVNNEINTLAELFRALLKIKIKPYYIHHPDPVKGTEHFRISLMEGLSLMKGLRGRISGLSIPQYMVELPESGGKVPLLPEYIKEEKDGVYRIENFEGKIIHYRDIIS